MVNPFKWGTPSPTGYNPIVLHPTGYTHGCDVLGALDIRVCNLYCRGSPPESSSPYTSIKIQSSLK